MYVSQLRTQAYMVNNDIAVFKVVGCLIRMTCELTLVSKFYNLFGSFFGARLIPLQTSLTTLLTVTVECPPVGPK